MTNLRKYADFTGENIYIGLDTHKRSFTVSIQGEEIKYKTFTQPPEPETLVNYLERNFPGGNYHAVYEASFSGFWIQEKLSSSGVNCIVVNPCDVPSTDKEKKQKRDRLDAIKLCKSLKQGALEGIHIPTKARQQDRNLIRVRQQLVGNQTRCRNRIKSLLDFYGIKLPIQFSQSGTHWSKNFMKWLYQVDLGKTSVNDALLLLLEEADSLRGLLLNAGRKLKVLSVSEKYQQNVDLLLSVPGIGRLTAMLFLTEIGELKRFSTFDKLCAYVGLIPNVYASGEKEKIGDITKRGNKKLRSALIESSWVAIQHDPALGLKYGQLCKHMKGNKAIVRIARKLLNRIRKVLVSKEAYQFNIAV